MDDYYYTNQGVITIPPGQTTGSLMVYTQTDSLMEGTENVMISGTANNGANVSGTSITINDPQPSPTVNLRMPDKTLAEENSEQVTLYAELSNPSVSDIQVGLSFTGTAIPYGLDYEASATAINIPAGATTGSITLTAKKDSIIEGDETFTVMAISLTGPATLGTTIQQTATITETKTEYVISGYIRDESGTGIEGVSITFSNSGGSTTTDSSGYYTKSINSGWNGTATTSKPGYTFYPASLSYPNITSSQINQNFTAKVVQYVLSGYIWDETGAGIEGVSITFSNNGGSTKTDSSGYYSKSVNSGWNGTATTSKPGYTFYPASLSYTNITSSQINQNFIGTINVCLISGYVRDDSNMGIKGVTITFSSNGGTAVTDGSGYYTKSLNYGWNGMATPAMPGYTFYPVYLSYSNVTGDQINQDFNGVSTGKAIIVAGRNGMRDSLWDHVQFLANQAYITLDTQGYSKDTIYYLSSNPDVVLKGERVVDNSATYNNLRYAIREWAKDTDDLFIYLVGHGANGKFIINDSETLFPSDLNLWMSEIRARVILLYEGCYSGSFIPYISPLADRQRIIITTSAANQKALIAGTGLVSFSSYFLQSMLVGRSFYECFTAASSSLRLSTEDEQIPMIDINGNGIGNEEEDKLQARTIKLGRECVFAYTIPSIGLVSAQILSDSTILIRAEDVYDEVERVWAVITPPDYFQDAAEDTITDLPVIDLSFSGNNKYEAVYSGMAKYGTYRIAVYAINTEGIMSPPGYTSITLKSPDSSQLTANFSASPTSGNAPLTVRFADQSAGTITSKIWNFGDGTTSTETNPVHIYNTPGTYTVSLIVSGPSGSHTTISDHLINVQTVSNSDLTNSMIFPHIASDGSWETEICIINTGDATINGMLKSYNNAGQEISSSKSIELKPHGRKEITISNEFVDAVNIGYMVFESDSQNTVGYTKFYIPGKYRVSVPCARRVNTGDIYISHIASDNDWWTGISLVNTTTSAKTLEFMFNNGDVKTLTLNPGEHRAFIISQLFGGYIPANIGSAVIRNGSGIVGLKLFASTDSSKTNYLEGVPLTDEAAADIYYPHIASDNEWWTGVVAYNPFAYACSLTITPFKADGTSLVSQTINVEGYGKYIGFVSNLNFPQGTAWFKINASSPVTGFGLFGTTDGYQLGGFSSIGISGKTGVFAKVESKGWTGIAFVNTENTSSTVTLTAYDNEGNAIAVENMYLLPYQKVVNFAEKLFSKNIYGATYIAYSSDKEVVGFQLNGSLDGNMLDGLPGMR